MKTNNIELEMGLFQGFYNSFYEDELDGIIDDELSEMGKDYDSVDISYDFEALAKDIFEFAENEYYSQFDFIQKMTFKELDSPRFYNYRNDKIYFDCLFDTNGFLSWLAELMTEGGDIWEAIIEDVYETHTSCSGFISFHSNSITDWIKDIFEMELDNEKTVYKIGFLLTSYLKNKSIFEDYNWSFEIDYVQNDAYYGIWEAFEIKELID